MSRHTRDLEPTPWDSALELARRNGHLALVLEEDAALWLRGPRARPTIRGEHGEFLMAEDASRGSGYLVHLGEPLYIAGWVATPPNQLLSALRDEDTDAVVDGRYIVVDWLRVLSPGKKQTVAESLNRARAALLTFLSSRAGHQR